MRTVVVLLMEGVIPFDVTAPLEIFGRTVLSDGRPGYRVLTAGPGGRDRDVGAGLLRMRPQHDLGAVRALGPGDTVIVPGLADLDTPVPDAVLGAVRAAVAGGARAASVCVGAFTLAATGLLDGRGATTHWAAADELARRHPAVRVDPDVLWVDEGELLTSAGAAAGLDLCLHLVRRDHGAAVAAHCARLSVLPLEREGGQAQFIDHATLAGSLRSAPGASGSSLSPLVEWMHVHHAEPLDLRALAAQSGLSTRTLSRRFAAQSGTTPLVYLTRLRIDRARQLLETTDAPVETIAALVGFTSPTAFRERFRAQLGTSPTHYRRTWTHAPA